YSHNIVNRARGQVVDQRRGLPQTVACVLGSDRHNAREHWRTQARATDGAHGQLAVDSLDNFDAGERIGQHGYIGHQARAARNAKAAMKIRPRKYQARAAAGPALKSEIQWWNHGSMVQCTRLGDASQVVSPAGFEGDGFIGVQRQAGAADSGREGRTG